MNIEENTEKQTCVITSDKLVTKVHIQIKPGGYGFFGVSFEKGLIPKDLQGSYSSLKKAKRAVEVYLKNMKQTKAARRNEFAKDFTERKRKNASNDKPKNGQHIRKRSGN
jgi:hypothetical protein